MDWLSAWAVLTTLAFVIYYFRSKWKNQELDLSGFIKAALALVTLLSSCNLMYQAFTSQELKNILGLNITILLLGAIAVIWISIQEIWQTFK